MKKYLAVIVLIAMVAAFAGLAFGHETVEVKNGADIKGVVKFRGSLPQDETIAIDRNAEVCGKEQKAGKYIVKDDKLRNAVVFIDEPKRGRGIPKGTVVDLSIKGCTIEPHVSIGFVGGKFALTNNDDILHTLQLKLMLEYQKKTSSRPVKDGATIYNLALPQKGRKIEKPVNMYHRYCEDTGFIRVTSNSHPWMMGYVFVFDHPYAAVTDENGSFAIEGLLPGEYTLKIWHEGLGWQEKKIKLSEKETASLEITYEK